MVTGTTIVAADDSDSAVSWKAILAGTVASAALTLVLVAFGVGVGFSVISPWNGSGISASTFTIGAGIYLIVIAMLSSTIGGYLAGRLRSKWPSVHEHERYFRDSAHGLLVWALATVVTAVFLGGAMTAIVGGAGVAATSAAASPMAATYVDQLMRTAPNRAANTAAAAPSSTQAAQQGAQQTTEQATSPSAVGQNPPALQGGQISSPATQGGARVNRGEITRIVAPALVKGGSLSDLNRAYLVQVVAERNGMTNAQAEQRVDEVLAQAKQAADKARKSTAAFAFWLTFAMLAGALSAALAAIEGGHLRNREWYLTEAKGQRVTAAK